MQTVTANIVLDDSPSPPPTFGTLPGVASMNSIYVSYDCGELEGPTHLECKGESLDGEEPDDSWDV